MASRDQFYMALQFLTRLPVPANIEHSDDGFARSARFYPAIGLIVGASVALVYAVADGVFHSGVAAVLAVFAATVLTGALHDDGLADSADGLIGGRDRDHTLTIMRDHQVGTYGVMALIFAVALKLMVLADLRTTEAILFLIAAHAVSRHAMVEVIARYDYARADTAKFARPAVGAEDLTFARLWAIGSLVVVALLGGIWATLIAALFTALVVSGFAQFFVRKIGGYTGDCLGATQQLAEVAFLLGALACL